jgi:hypothetical protein
VVFGLRQQYGAGNISMVNATAARVHGPLTICVLVLNGTTNGSSNANTSNSTGGQQHLKCCNVTLIKRCECTCFKTCSTATASVQQRGRVSMLLRNVFALQTALKTGTAVWPQLFACTCCAVPSAGVAFAVFENVTFNCEYWRNGTTAGALRSIRLLQHDQVMMHMSFGMCDA